MKIYYGFDDKRLRFRNRSIAIGIFDGVHRGHQKILKKMLQEARWRQSLSTVVTFEPHPNKILKPRVSHPILMSLAHRLQFFEKLGVSETLIVHFDHAFSKISYEDFLQKYLIRRLNMKSLCVGHDFRFGFKGLGGVDYLQQKASWLGFDFFAVRPLKFGGQTISSTSIRRLIEQGRLVKAANMLGRPVSVYGTVVSGKGRGKSIGFPTANINPHHETLPPSGVYAAWGLFDGHRVKGVLHIGQRPTFNEKEKTLEVHFLNFHKNLYGKELELLFVKRLRPIRQFADSGRLAEAIQQDIRKAKKLLRKF